MQVTCIMCPKGCELEVTKTGRKIVVTGGGCPRGVIYGEREIISPERMVTTIKKCGERTITLKTDKPVPKQKVFECLKSIKKCKLPKNVSLGMVLISKVASTDCDVIVTGISK